MNIKYILKHIDNINDPENPDQALSSLAEFAKDCIETMNIMTDELFDEHQYEEFKEKWGM